MFLVAALTLLLSLAGPGFAQQRALDILAAQCLDCHGAAGMGGLDLRTREAMLVGGKRGPSTILGSPAQSLLVQVISGRHELRMPMGKQQLTADDVAQIESWIADGAPWEPRRLASAEAGWWAFRSPVKPPAPAGGNSIDSFIDRTLEVKGLDPVLPADRRTLIRRAYFDLHGLPPTPEAVDAFVSDPSPDAWARIIDELLDSPRYGERWGRHWLDVVRYADTGGFETDIYFPNAWRYRDYVIDSFNRDKPFDRFVQEQIAGDQLWPDDLELRGGYQIPPEKLASLEARIGTGLYTIGPVYHEAALDGRQLRYEWLTDAVDTTGSAFLGLTLGCARCHDHKFDALSQRDYHRMMAVFSGSEPRNIPVVHKMSEFGFYAGYPKLLKVEEYQQAIKRIDSAVRSRAQKQVEAQFGPEVIAAHQIPEGERTQAQRDLAALLEAALTEAGLKENPTGKRAELVYEPAERDERDRLLYELGKAALAARVSFPQATVIGQADVAYPVHITSRGDFRLVGDQVDAGFPAVLEDQHRGFGESTDSVPGKRAALARWLTDINHPLTARVIVNRVWQWHFGRGIVATPNDFGRQGEPPTHPQLLDWLAVDFVENGWSLNRLHRMIMASSAYQRSSAPHQANARIDAQNRYLWRMNRRRLEAEALRDSVLAVAGTLELQMGGRPVIPPLSEDEMRGMWATEQWPVSLDPAQHNRRSVYLYVKRSFPMPMFTTFDAPDSSVSCARRDQTTVAPQALAMLNSEFMIKQAAAFAGRIRGEGADALGQGADQRTHRAWRLALGRNATPAELSTTQPLVAAETSGSLEQLALLLFNLNEFSYID